MLDLNVLTQAIGDLDEGQVVKLLEEFVESKPSSTEANQVVGACQQGMSIVGDYFEKKEYYVGDLIFAGELLNRAIEILRPVIGGENTNEIGSIVVGTVQGDMHDIGKNIFASMVEAAGFKVYDLGIDVPPAAFVEKVKEVNADVLGLSGVLTLAIDSMKATVNALNEVGLRGQVKVIIGGNPVTEDACKQIGADMFTTNAAEGVKICQRWVE